MTAFSATAPGTLAAGFFAVALALFAAGTLWLGVSAWRARRRRERFLSAPLPKKWAKILLRDVPVSAKIPQELRARYARRVKEFLAEKNFEACGGLTGISEKTALVIAANASLLALGRDVPAWRALRSVLVYPTAFRIEDPTENAPAEAGEICVPVDEKPPCNDGESRAAHGVVILSHERLLRDAAYSGNASNVVIHEFAHQFADTEPLFFPRERVRAWETLFEKEMARLRAGDAASILDDYGAEDAAEFFAVCTEAFFGTPQELRRAHPEIYAALAEIYALDPASWNEIPH